MIWCCAKSKERSLKLFPTSGPNNFNEKIFKNLTREIFADSIGALISIWVHIWEET